MIILVSNVGSTSLKFKLYNLPSEKLLCEAKIESVGSRTDARYYYRNAKTGETIELEGLSIPEYITGIRRFLNSLTDPQYGVIENLSDIGGVGFKTVIAKDYYGVHELTEEVLNAMNEYIFLAPAHNGPYLQAINVFKNLLPGTPMIGVFETAFHTTIPAEARTYSIPFEWSKKYGIMRLGFHGASHSYIAHTIQERFGINGRLISCHLGGSCSICAVKNGKSIDNSFGFSPQAGVMHANRVGDCDPYIFPFLLSKGMSVKEILAGFGKNGGLLGISGISNDLRKVEQCAEEGNERAVLAINVLVHDIVRYIGSYYVELGGLDYLVFTGGIGENSAILREQICRRLSCIGIHMDTEKNKIINDDCCISKPESNVKVYVIPTNEEIGIARETYKKIQQ